MRLLLTECLAQIGQEAGVVASSEHSKMKQILSLKAVHVLAVFVLIYVGQHLFCLCYFECNAWCRD